MCFQTIPAAHSWSDILADEKKCMDNEKRNVKFTSYCLTYTSLQHMRHTGTPFTKSTNSNMNKLTHTQWPVLCGMKLTIRSQTSTSASLEFGNRQVISSHNFYRCNYLSMLGLESNYICIFAHICTYTLLIDHGRKVWGEFCVFKFWSGFDRYHCLVVLNMILY